MHYGCCLTAVPLNGAGIVCVCVDLSACVCEMFA